MKTLATFLLFGTMMFADFSLAQDAETSDRVVQIDSALVSSIRDIQVPARVKGFLSQMNFEEGDFVDEGTVIAELDTASIDGELESARIRFENAQLQADDNSAVDYAQASFDLAKQEYETEQDLLRKRATTKQELDRKQLTARQAQLQVVRSLAQKKIDGGAVRIEEQAVKSVQMLKDRHTIMAEFAGQIMTIERKAGESVQEGQTVLRLVDLSQVKVEGNVNSGEANPSDLKGKPVVVTLRLAGNESATFDGFVKTVGLNYSQARGGSGNFVVQAVVTNQKANEAWLLHPGASVSMDIKLD